MSKIRSTNTTPEILLRKFLWAKGFRYRKKSSLPGKPDIILNNKKIVIFIDGEFWHGYQWNKKRQRIKANREYWIKKIEGNIRRDKSNKKQLIKMGYTVIRFWEHQIKKDIAGCVLKISELS
jgi:DNA mismatch endonuclease (patch repair protein)